MERHLNSLLEFTQALGAESISANTMIYNKRYSAITLNRSLLSSTYMEEGIIQVLIDQPVDDAFRGGITINCPELSGDDIKLLVDELSRREILLTYAQALKWMRLFGGAGVIINFGQDLTKPMRLEQLKQGGKLAFYPADRWELCYAPQGMESLDLIQKKILNNPYNYYGHPIHESHVIKLKGKEPPSLLKGQFSGWGMSELEKMVRSFNNYIKHQNVTFELLDEAKVDVMKVVGFNSAIASSHGAEMTARRVNLAAQIKNYQNALVIDADDDYEQKQVSFSGLSEILTQLRIGLACDLRMPMTKLFGLSASGFNSGEDDIENYNSMIETEIRSKVKPGLIVMLNLLCKQIFDYIPETMDFDYHPLREMDSKEQSIIRTDSLNRVVTSFQNGLITNEKAIELINASKVFDIDLPENESMSLEEMKEMTSGNIDSNADNEKIGKKGE